MFQSEAPKDASVLSRVAVTVWLFAVDTFAAIARKYVGDIEPGNPFLMIPVSVGYKGVGIIERADINLDYHVFPVITFPSQRRSALATEGTCHPRR